MAKLKADWLKEAKALKLEVTTKNTAKEIQTAVEKAQATAQDTPDSAPKETSDATTAKAGKRSKKALEEAEIKAAKEARKRGEADTDADTGTDQEPTLESKKGPIPVARPKIERQSKRFQKAAASVDKSKEYELSEAVKLAVATSKVNFDSTLELHVRLNADPKQADQNIRETVVLPHGTGRTLRVAVFAEEADQKKALAAGADLVGEKEILDLLTKEQFDFDVLIATPQLMSQLGRFAKTLGPKGLMPNPKSGTVSKNVESAVKQAKAGRVEFRIDKQGIVHVPAGKVSFGAAKLQANVQTILDAIRTAKPASIKSQYVVAAHLSTSMGPGIKLSSSSLLSTIASK